MDCQSGVVGLCLGFQLGSSKVIIRPTLPSCSAALSKSVRLFSMIYIVSKIGGLGGDAIRDGIIP